MHCRSRCPHTAIGGLPRRKRESDARRKRMRVFKTMFAALLAAVAHYIYFRFIDHGYVINTCETMVDTLAQSNMPGMDSYIATYQEALETARLLSPIDITLQMISSNVFWGSILAFPTALFVMRRKKDNAPAK